MATKISSNVVVSTIIFTQDKQERCNNMEEELCEVCGCEHVDAWEAMACWDEANDPDYDPFDI